MKTIKKYLTILCTMLVMVSCNEMYFEQETIPTKLEFAVTVNHGMPTKAVKTAFVSGDVVYAFFNNVALSDTPKYATLTYDGTKWTGALQGGLTISELAASGETMSAVFFPFGTVNITKSGDSYVFKGADNQPIYTYYMSATADYSLTAVDDIATLTATLDMTIPDNYVQFFVDKSGSDYASDGKYRLAVKDIRPAACNSYTPTGGFTMKTQDYSQPMWGYVYNNEGILFSGQINESAWGSATERRFIFFETGKPAKSSTISKTLTSHAAVKLANVASWPAAITVPGAVDMGLYKNNDSSTGKLLLWADRNLGATTTGSTDYGFYLAWGEIVPYVNTASTWQMKTEMSNTKYYWYDAAAGDNSKYPNDGNVLESVDDAATAYLGDGWRLPTKEELQALYALGPVRSTGWTFSAANGNSIFLPLGGRFDGTTYGGNGSWTNIISSTKAASPLIWYSYEGGVTSENGRCWIGHPVRPVKEVQAISNLVHYWPFNGNLNDAVTEGAIDATNIYSEATLTEDRHGNANSAYSFDGDDVMSIGSAGNFGASSFTANMWICTTTTGSCTLIRTEEASGGIGWFIRFDSSNIEIWASSNNKVVSMSINDGSWHMITFVQDADNKVGQLYVDGVIKGSYSMSTVPSVTNGNTHVLGSGMTTPYYTYVGKMDEVRLYNKALTAEEVAALYQY